ncbi:MAG: sugar ABC transporter ATP-binding protein [Anaerolineales bacterium]|nr:sugar ABC transporter ATP-binding protein [Anaerolineales bacterium]
MAEANTTILTMRGINKTFPGVKALTDVDLSLNQGEIHALLGQNGAGKSTLIKVLTGAEQADSGEIILEGKTIHPRSPQHAQELGISTVYQEINLCPNLSVAENIFIGREPRKLGSIHWKVIERQAAEILQTMGIEIDVTQSLESYSIAIQQMVAIARSLQISARILILDEPTSSLDEDETSTLFNVMKRLKNDGIGIIFITHFIDQVYQISDRITILRNGRLIGEYETSELPRYNLVSLMIGKKLENLDQLTEHRNQVLQRSKHELVLEGRRLGAAGKIEPFDLSLYAGEVVGFAGLLGSGRTEAARLLFGLDRCDSGMIFLDQQPVKSMTPGKAIKFGIAFCPEDRKENGVIADLTVRENIILALQTRLGWFRFLNRKQQEKLTSEFIDSLFIQTPSPNQLVRNLSGGNQQKVILARWLAINPRILILDEPTRGIDIGTKAEIQKLVLDLAMAGKAILFISSELEEVIRCSHRIKVLRGRQMVKELTAEEVNGSSVLTAIAGS